MSPESPPSTAERLDEPNASADGTAPTSLPGGLVVPAASELSLDEPLSPRTEHSRSLRSKIVLSLALMLTIVVAIDEVVRREVIAPEFVNLERFAALKDGNRVLLAVNAEVEFLAETAEHDVHWIGEEALNYSLWRSSSRPSDLSHRVQWSAIVTSDGEWTRPKHRDQATDRCGFPGIDAAIANRAPLDESTIRGLTRGTDDQLYLFAAVKIQTLGPANYYVVGRRFDDQLIAEIGNRTSVPFSISTDAPDGNANQPLRVSSIDPRYLELTYPLLDPVGKSLASLRASMRRDVVIRSNRITAFARYLSLCGSCVSLLLLLLLLQRMVIGRLTTIREHTDRIARSGIITDESTEPVLRVAGRDEIGQLALSFDRMRSRLGDAQRQLSHASHAAGMSLVADTVIHNVGNVLTNVNSLIETATRRVESLRTEPLERLAHRLKESDDETMRSATPQYLQRLSETLEDDKGELSMLLQTLADNVRHINQVIHAQQRHANQPLKWSQLDLKTVISEAIRYSHAKLQRDNVRVDLVCDPGVVIRSDRSLLLQILINVIGNAGQATRGLTDRQPQLIIEVVQDEETVQIRMQDNGCGMSESTLARVFDAHFTTRPSGTGLGLHFCALAVKRIKGSIHVESEGPGRGAAFTVSLPIETTIEPERDRRETSRSPRTPRQSQAHCGVS